MISLGSCQAKCVEDPSCAYVDYDPTSGCYHSEFCQEKSSFVNSNIYQYVCSSKPDCDVATMQSIGGNISIKSICFRFKMNKY